MTAPAAQPTLAAVGGGEPTSPPTGGAPPGAPPDRTRFHRALETESARTAIAEGQQQSRSEGAAGASSAVAPPAATLPMGALVTPAAPDAEDAVGLAVASGSERSADARGASAAPDARTGARPAGDSTPATASRVSPALDDASGGRTNAGPTASGHDTGASAHPTPDPPASSYDTGASAHPTPDPPAAGEALPGVSAGSDPAGWVGSDFLPKTLPDTVAPGAAGSGSHTRRGIASQPRASAPAAGALAEDVTAGGGSSSPPTGTRRPAAPVPHSASGAGAHDKLWVPDPETAGTGTTGADTGGSAAGGVGFSEGANSAQPAAPPGGDQSGIGQQGPLLDYGVGLQQAIENLHGTIELAARQGLSQARIALEPEGLGEIRIHLTQTAQGLLARISAETPVAAQALAAAHAELRQSLSSLGLDLARLNIGRHGHAAAQDGGAALAGGDRGTGGGGALSSRGSRSGATAASVDPTDLEAELAVQASAPPSSPLSGGALVDVLV
jgi:hypothetical protein